jgi:hypothetical protein
VLTGFSAVSRGRLKTLSTETLAELVRSDELELIYSHLHSMRNFDAMRARVPAGAEKEDEDAGVSDDVEVSESLQEEARAAEKH